ncbi:hypothetical protein [Bacillus thuringiensis]|uniref:hypothetical protein n=1 Tax=Bacillus thuringiensis TaxID=1428 RepID=UPI001596C1DB|nr:hypothetical protein [Bacillus thuringiensis]
MKIKFKESLSVLFIFSLFFTALFFDENATVSGAFICLFSILTENKFSKLP